MVPNDDFIRSIHHQINAFPYLKISRSNSSPSYRELFGPGKVCLSLIQLSSGLTLSEDYGAYSKLSANFIP